MDTTLLDGGIIATGVAFIGVAARFVVSHKKLISTVLTAAESLNAAAGADGKLAPSELPAAFEDYKARTAAEIAELRSHITALAEAHGPVEEPTVELTDEPVEELVEDEYVGTRRADETADEKAAYIAELEALLARLKGGPSA